jgi:hypothetical protein
MKPAPFVFRPSDTSKYVKIPQNSIRKKAIYRDTFGERKIGGSHENDGAFTVLEVVPESMWRKIYVVSGRIEKSKEP